MVFRSKISIFAFFIVFSTECTESLRKVYRRLGYVNFRSLLLLTVFQLCVFSSDLSFRLPNRVDHYDDSRVSDPTVMVSLSLSRLRTVSNADKRKGGLGEGRGG